MLLLYLGPMYAGKTTSVIKELTQFVDATNSTPTLLIKSTIDTRDRFNQISSHSSSYQGVSSSISIQSVSRLADADVRNYTTIGIDEAQFFPDLVVQVLQWVDQGKHLYLSALNGDANQNRFGDLDQLLPHVDRCKFLTAICRRCLDETTTPITPESLKSMRAPFTIRIGGLANQIDVGGLDKYIPVCRRHKN